MMIEIVLIKMMLELFVMVSNLYEQQFLTVLSHVAPCTHGSVSLLDYSGTPILTKDGILRICLNKTQGTICDNSWGYRDASVACNALGYSPYGKNNDIMLYLLYLYCIVY